MFSKGQTLQEVLTVNENTFNSQQKKHCGLKARNHSWFEFFYDTKFNQLEFFFKIEFYSTFSNDKFAFNEKCALYHRDETPSLRLSYS